MGKPFSPQRLENIRRMRKARRLFRDQPLFATAIMQASYPSYCSRQLWEDLRRRRPKKKRTRKQPLSRYGRYNRMEELLACYRNTGEMAHAIAAARLRAHMTKPYRLLVTFCEEEIEYALSPMIPVGEVEKLSIAIRACRSEAEATAMVEAFRKRMGMY